LASATKALPGPDQHVDRRDRLRAERHGADRLDAAQRVDLVRAGHRLRSDDRRRGLAFERRSAGDHARHAGDLGGDHAHVRRGEQRIFAAGHVAAGAVHRHVLVAEDHAGQRLDLDLLHAVLLDLREVAHLRLRELDVLQVLAGELVDAVLHLLRREAVILAVPAVELDRQLAHRRIAAALDVGKRRFDRVAHLAVEVRTCLRRHAALQPVRHAISSA
jgi:hypothetical protein